MKNNFRVSQRKRRRLTPNQFKFFEDWHGQAVVVRTVDEALRAIGAID